VGRGCTIGSRGEVPGERELVIRDDGGGGSGNNNNNNNNIWINKRNSSQRLREHLTKI
jgi:hypothetical protein